MRKTVLVLAAITAGCSKTPVCENDVAAFTMAQTFIKRQLKSPATAEFPFVNADGVSVTRSTHSGRCSFLVSTYVDASNSFGAKIRENYIVELTPDDAGREWTAISVSQN